MNYDNCSKILEQKYIVGKWWTILRFLKINFISFLRKFYLLRFLRKLDFVITKTCHKQLLHQKIFWNYANRFFFAYILLTELSSNFRWSIILPFISFYFIRLNKHQYKMNIFYNAKRDLQKEIEKEKDKNKISSFRFQ